MPQCVAGTRQHWDLRQGEYDLLVAILVQYQGPGQDCQQGWTGEECKSLDTDARSLDTNNKTSLDGVAGSDV